jgi:hypothetical protein
MHKLVKNLSLVSFALLMSCNMDRVDPISEIAGMHFRNLVNPQDWCDGGASDPLGLAQLSSSLDSITGDCCVTFLIYETDAVRANLTTTDYNFDLQQGSPAINFHIREM